MRKIVLSIIIVLSTSLTVKSQEKTKLIDCIEYDIGFGVANNKNELITVPDTHPDSSTFLYVNIGIGVRTKRFFGGLMFKMPIGQSPNFVFKPFYHIMGVASLNLLPNKWDKFYFGPKVGYGLTTPWKTRHSTSNSSGFKFKFPAEMYGGELVTRFNKFDLRFSYQHFKWFEHKTIVDPIWGTYERNYIHVMHDFSISVLLSNKTFK